MHWVVSLEYYTKTDLDHNFDKICELLESNGISYEMNDVVVGTFCNDNGRFEAGEDGVIYYGFICKVM